MRKQLLLACCVAAGLALGGGAAFATGMKAADAKPAGMNDMKPANAPSPAIDPKLMDAISKAAPKNVVDHATIMDVGADGKMTMLRQGDNGFTCMNPDNSPMCADEGAMQWIRAWQGHGSPSKKLGFIYMLAGDTGTSNTDPYATKETPDNNWVKTGSHVMIVGMEARDMMQSYPHDAKPDTSKPYVMWPDTPYAHLMLPVQ
jgi:hypothetical protein